MNWEIENWNAMIDIAEKLLIRAHSPALNKQGTTGLFLDDELKRGEKTNSSKEKMVQHYLILNWGEYGSLLPEVSTLRNSYRFWEFDQVVGKL